MRNKEATEIRKISLSDYVYQIVLDNKTPKIVKNRINMLKAVSGTQHIYFYEYNKDQYYVHKEDEEQSYISYEFRGSNWTEKDRGEIIYNNHAKDFDYNYWLSEEEAIKELKRQKEELIFINTKKIQILKEDNEKLLNELSNTITDIS